VSRAEVEAIVDEVLGADLKLAHVHAAREVEVAVEQVAVAVLLGRPAPDPLRPAVVAVAVQVVELVEPGFVVGRASSVTVSPMSTARRS
jgi:hypothetical protein